MIANLQICGSMPMLAYLNLHWMGAGKAATAGVRCLCQLRSVLHVLRSRHVASSLLQGFSHEGEAALLGVVRIWLSEGRINASVVRGVEGYGDALGCQLSCNALYM